MFTSKKHGLYFYGLCQHCHKPKKENRPGFCRSCFWNPEKRFWSNVEKTPTCWIWTGNKHRFGYGVMRFRKKSMGAHRASWIMQNGAIPKGMSVLHHCDNPPCVFPEHLFLGDQADNMRDRSKKFRQPFGEKCVRSKLSEKEVFKIKSLYKPRSSNFNQVKLAKMFRVSQAAISLILLGHNWKYLEA